MMSENESGRSRPGKKVEPAEPAPKRFPWWEWFDVVLELLSYVLVLFLE